MSGQQKTVFYKQYAHTGQYVLTKDSLAPTIKPLNSKNPVDNYKFLEVEVDDAFSGIKSYH